MEESPKFWLQWITSNKQKMDGEQLSETLKRATSSNDQYKDDPNLMLLWLERIKNEQILNVSYENVAQLFKQMASQRIGIKNPDLYIQWADFEDSSGNNSRAQRILQAGLQSNVMPRQALEQALARLESKENNYHQPEKTLNKDLPKQDSLARPRRPLQEKSDVKPKTEDEKLTEEHTGTFKQSLNRWKTSRLGPPSRKPKNDLGEPPLSPESMTTSPAVTNISTKAEAENLDSPTQKNVEQKLTEMADMDLSETVVMQKARTVTKRESSASLDTKHSTISQSWPTLSEAKLNPKDKRYSVVNGKVYLRSELIGHGGSCKVFKIISQEGQVYALKKIKLRGQDASVVAGYKNEIILLNKLKDNERIIRLLDAEQDQSNGTLLMVLEYGEIDLEKLLQKSPNEPLSINLLRNYWEQMLQAVQAIHDQNIIHSDLKPANFLLVRGCLKLIDFGIAKAIPNDTTNIQRDHQTGTLNYMSPEAIMYVEIKGTKQNYLKQGRASDVWSLGCILYRFVYLHPPFGNLPLMGKIRSITDPNHVIEYPPTEDTNIVSILKGCLIYDPKMRFKIPELLQHPFLKPTKVLSKDSVAHILRRALQLHLNEDNCEDVARDIIKELFPAC